MLEKLLETRRTLEGGESRRPLEPLLPQAP
jgi:hypothetical protein